MKEAKSIFYQTRRRFLGMLGALGAMVSLPALGSRKCRLSRHEASFYRKGPHHG